MKIEKTPSPENPALIDSVLVEIQKGLIEKLTWLHQSFGKSQKLVRKVGNNSFWYPAVHIGQGDYLSVMPDERIGNFSFFVIEDPQVINKDSGILTTKASLIFWFNLNKIFKSNDREIEVIKSQIITVLDKIYLKNGRFTISKIMEQAENIYKGFSLKEVDSQFLMQPYGGLRFEGELIVKLKEC
ncbi:MAG: hypothetical protein ACRCZY_02545 [Phocaeicola sp.]